MFEENINATNSLTSVFCSSETIYQKMSPCPPPPDIPIAHHIYLYTYIIYTYIFTSYIRLYAQCKNSKAQMNVAVFDYEKLRQFSL